MADIPPEIHLLALRVKAKNGVLPGLTKNMFYRMLEDAEEYNGLYLAFWECRGVKSLFAYRKDRSPTDDEVLPWAQELFDNGEIHRELGKFHMWCVQGDALYTEESVADMAGTAFANSAEKTDKNADAFDFDRTKVGKSLSRKLRNGTH